MAHLLKCDRHDCSRTTDPDHPFGWVKIMVMSPTLSQKEEYHYCSMQHAHDHTYLLISGDNGK